MKTTTLHTLDNILKKSTKTNTASTYLLKIYFNVKISNIDTNYHINNLF